MLDRGGYVRWGQLLAMLGFRRSPQGHIRVQDVTTGEIRWVDPSTLTASPVRHELSEEQMDRVRRLHERLEPLDGWTLEKRTDLFARDLDPDREIAICDQIAGLCERAFQDLGLLTSVQKREIYGVLMAYSGAPVTEVLKHYTPRSITVEQARHVLSLS